MDDSSGQSAPQLSITPSRLGLITRSRGAQTRLCAQGTAFTYQGRLNAGGTPAHALYEMSFALYDAPTNGNGIGTPVNLAPVAVSNGLFTVTLDFGVASFTGADRWLEITVNLFGSDMVPTTLHPRQWITPAPYAIRAANAGNLMSTANAPLEIKVNGQRALRLEPTGNAPNLIGGSSNNFVKAGTVGATIAGGKSNAVDEFARLQSENEQLKARLEKLERLVQNGARP